jgi:hypothetical protein
MLEHRQLLNFDAFSHTRLGQAWVNHSWLAELHMAGVYALAGYSGLNLVTALVIWLTFLFVYLSGEGGPYLRAFAIVIAATTSAVYWSARPQIVSMLLTAVFSCILILYRWRGRNVLWILPLIMVLWVNLHGGFAVGFILLVIVFVGFCLEFALGRLGLIEPKVTFANIFWLAGTGLICAAAVTLNPYGPQMLLYPFRTVSIGALQNYIQEWQSPNFHAREAQVFIAMWLLTFGVVGAARARLNLTDFLLFSAFSVLALLAGRNIAVFAVVTAPLLMRYADSAVTELQERWPVLKIGSSPWPISPVRQFLHWALLALVAAAVLLKVSLPLNPDTTTAAIAQTAPVGAATYLKAHPVVGNLFNSYNFGGYLTWALYPAKFVFVDGRTDLYDDLFLNEYLNTYQAGPGWEQTFAKYGIGVVLVEANAPIARQLTQTPGWAVRYSDLLSVVFVKTQ